MTPKIKTERLIEATIELHTALHIGVGKGNQPTDSPLRRTSDGRITIPGRAFGGALRTTATRLAPRLNLVASNGREVCLSLEPKPSQQEKSEDINQKGQFCGCLVCQLFGELNPNEEDDEEEGGAASRLWISDAFVPDAKTNGPQTHVRDGVGLSRDQGVAARNIKFDFETVPCGAAFVVRLRLVDDESEEAAITRARLLAAVLAEWEAGRGRLGAGAARGLGAVTLNVTRYLKTSLNSADDIVAYLKALEPELLGKDDAKFWQDIRAGFQKPEAFKPWAHKEIPAARGFVAVSFTLNATGPFLVNDPLTAMLSGFDHAPHLTVAIGGAGLPLLSGGSMRGALRARAERIARTLWAQRWSQAEDFLSRCPACSPLARHWRAPLASCDSRLLTPTTQETAAADLCLACQLFGNSRRGSRLWIEDAHWASDEPSETSWKAQDFLAIDRFTGGGQDGAKFDAAPLSEAKFKTCLTLHDPAPWELGWLALTLRDLRDGLLTIGFGAAKGYGRVAATDFVWQIGTLRPDDLQVQAALLDGGKQCGLYYVAERSWEEMADQMQQWLQKFLDLREEPIQPRPNVLPLKEDTFIGQATEALYGLPRTSTEAQ